MSRHDPSIRIQHMLDHAREAREMTADTTRDSFDHDRMLTLAVTRLLEIVGEAASKVPQEIREGHDEIPWRAMISMRNRLIHGYDNIDLDILWVVVSEELSSLIEQLETLLREVS